MFLHLHKDSNQLELEGVQSFTWMPASKGKRFGLSEIHNEKNLLSQLIK